MNLAFNDLGVNEENLRYLGDGLKYLSNSLEHLSLNLWYN